MALLKLRSTLAKRYLTIKNLYSLKRIQTLLGGLFLKPHQSQATSLVAALESVNFKSLIMTPIVDGSSEQMMVMVIFLERI